MEIADLQTRALLVIYKKTIQGAVREVDTNLGLYSAQQASLDKLGTALLASQRAVTLANERYERGLTDYLNVVDAERQEYDIEEQYAATQVAAAEDSSSCTAVSAAVGRTTSRYRRSTARSRRSSPCFSGRSAAAIPSSEA